MPNQPSFDPELPVKDLLERFPAARDVFARYGIDTCCGGIHPLTQACAAKGVPLAQVLAELGRAQAARPAAPACPGPQPFPARFPIAGLVLTLTLGALAGMFYLWRMGMGVDVLPSHRQIHAHTQIFGFAALFVMGVAFHALPRILGADAPSPGTVRLAFWLMLSGVVLRNSSQPFVYLAAGRLAALLSAALELGAGLLFAVYVFGALRDSPGAREARRDPFLLFLFAGTVYFLLALAVNALQGLWLARSSDPSLPLPLNESFYFVSLFGFLLAWIYGFASRMVAMFLAVGPARPRFLNVSLFLQAGGVVLFPLSFLPGVAEGPAAALRDLGTALAALSAVAYLVGTGFLWRRPAFPILKFRGLPHLPIRIAFALLGLWALLTLGAVLLGHVTPFPAQNRWWADSARHLFTAGFLTLLIVGMGTRVLPVFTGRVLWSHRVGVASWSLILAGVALRLLQYPAAFRPDLYKAATYSGVPIVLGLALFALNVVKTLRGTSPAPAPVPMRRPEPILLPSLPTR